MIRRAVQRTACASFEIEVSGKPLEIACEKHRSEHLRDLDRDPLNQATVRCFCQVAQVLGVATIAEFVDSERVFDALNALGVDYAQGYLLHRPEPLASLFPA